MGNMIKVGMADLKVCKCPDALTTLGLGSCVGVALYDPVTKISGLLHCMLPDSTQIRNNSNLAKFADTGIDELIRQMAALGANKNRLVAKIAGGAQMFAMTTTNDSLRGGAHNAEAAKTYEELVAEYGKLPNGFNALAPILVPIILMALGSISSMAGWTGVLDIACQFLGKPIIALAVGTIFGVIQLATAHKMSDFYNITNETLKTVGPILFVTAAGGVLGKVISSSSMVAFITQHAEVLSAVGIFFPFLLAAILKTAQGSSTVAITTTAGIIAPLLGALGLASPVKTVLCVMAIGAGAMTVSHANDSYFWVVTNFGDMNPEQGYKTQTVCTLIMGIAAMVEIFILSLIL